MEYIVGSVIAGLIVALVVGVVRFFLRRRRTRRGGVQGVGIMVTGDDATLIGNVVVNDSSRGHISDKAIMGGTGRAGDGGRGGDAGPGGPGGGGGGGGGGAGGARGADGGHG